MVFSASRLQIWYEKSYLEKKIKIEKTDTSYVIIPESFYKKVGNLSNNKIYNFCFIGAINTDKDTLKNRKWIIDFITKYFNDESYLEFTDRRSKMKNKTLGNFDYTLKRNGFTPKQVCLEERGFFDKDYYEKMCQSKFCLCPAGDKMYSMRFYEALMCKTIPIVDKKEETFRTKAESKLDYRYYLRNKKIFKYRKEWAEHNYNLFLKHHTLKYM